MRELALFAGAGGGILGGLLLGWRTVCAVEIDAYARSVLLARQRDGLLERFPVWDDVRTFDGHPWRGHIDIISGGFPCQDISAGGGGAGLDGERSGLWREFARIIREVRPRYVFVENSPMLTSRGLGRVLGDLAEMGFDARWAVLGACDAGAAHIRDRIWILADAAGFGLATGVLAPNRANVGGSESRRERWWMQQSARSRSDALGESKRRYVEATDWAASQAEPALVGKSDAVAHWVDRIRAIGNGQVPTVVRLAWETLSQDYG